MIASHSVGESSSLVCAVVVVVSSLVSGSFVVGVGLKSPRFSLCSLFRVSTHDEASSFELGFWVSSCPTSRIWYPL